MSELVLYEDEHLLVVNKPSGVNTHKPDRYAADGLHEWLGRREPRWRGLSILHRLDKETSGVMVFGKTADANRSLSRQFEAHQVGKRYLLLSNQRPRRGKCRAQSPQAVTYFEFLQAHRDGFLIEARPITGKTHQIRQHATQSGFPVLGDREYGGAPACRLMLHARELRFEHPTRREPLTFQASVPSAFETGDPLDAAAELRELVCAPDTDAYRLVNAGADGCPGTVVERYGEAWLVQWLEESAANPSLLERLGARAGGASVYQQTVTRNRRTAPVAVTEQHGPAAMLTVSEHGMRYRIRMEASGLSPGLFLDQRENRRRLLESDLTGRRVLNCFAYTCSFSVVAARAGAVVTSVDLARSYLDWGRENFRLNDLNPDDHDFIHGDVMEWVRRFARRGQTWDLVMLDPPTFSTTRKGRSFRAARDYAALVQACAPLLAPGATLFCSTNQRTFAPAAFEQAVTSALTAQGRSVRTTEFVTQPFDFRVGPGERAYLKTLWLELAH